MAKVFYVLFSALLATFCLVASSFAQSPILLNTEKIQYFVEKANLDIYVSGNSIGAHYRICVSTNSPSKSIVKGKNVGTKDIAIGTCIDIEDVSIQIVKISSGSINSINFGTYQLLR